MMLFISLPYFMQVPVGSYLGSHISLGPISLVVPRQISNGLGCPSPGNLNCRGVLGVEAGSLVVPFHEANNLYTCATPLW